MLSIHPCTFVARGTLATILFVGGMAATGCQKGEEAVPVADNRSAAATEQPAANVAADEVHSPDAATAVIQFLEAFRIGDEAASLRLLTAKARTELAKENFYPNPPASSTAEFTVGHVNFVGANQESAQVASSWSDYNERGELYTQEVIWILRKGGANWRIAGMAAPATEGDAGMVMNFENASEMKMRWAEMQSPPTRVGTLPR